MNTILDYLAVDIVTMYENNIKLHFFDYVERYVNVSWKKKELVEWIKRHRPYDKRDRLISNLATNLRKIKNDLLFKTKTSNPIYHEWIEKVCVKIFPQRKLQEDNMYYDIQCSPQDYLPHMFSMMKELESLGLKLNSVCPLRTDIVPKHIRIDTTSLVHICLTEEQGTKEEFLTKGNLVRNQSNIWGFFFKTNKKCFHLSDTHKYTFDHMISTDGVSCSILLIKKELQGRSIFRFKPRRTPPTEKYIDELEDPEYTRLQEKNVVGVDPGLNDLIYCVNGDQKDTISKFRYSQNQRRQETKSKKYRDLTLEWKKEIVAHQDVVRWETELSHYNKKTLDFGRFQDYIEKKNNINFNLQDFYQRYIFRKLKLGGYMRRQKTESMMMKRFKKIFGSPEETIIGIGEFEQKQHRKFKEPIKGKGFRTLFRRHGYEVYLVDEHKTSCRCANCGSETKTFRWCQNPKYWKENIIKRHGLLRCKNGCGLWNRDTNGAINIWKIAKEAIGRRERPEYLKRTKRSISGVTSTPTTQDLHEDPLTF
jgi:transposase